MSKIEDKNLKYQPYTRVVILTKFLKIAMLHVVLDWQKVGTYVNGLEKALFFIL